MQCCCLDEVEKGAPGCYERTVATGPWTTARLADGNGRSVDFRNSGFGDDLQRGWQRSPVAPACGIHGPGPQQRHVLQPDRQRAFSPELRNRLDAIVQFAPLDEDSILAVVGQAARGSCRNPWTIKASRLRASISVPAAGWPGLASTRYMGARRHGPGDPRAHPGPARPTKSCAETLTAGWQRRAPDG